MADTSPQGCPKCAGAMEQGFVVDQDYGRRRLSQWAAGAPRKSFMSGTKVPVDQPIPIGVYRCESCGYLESYARPELGAS